MRRICLPPEARKQRRALEKLKMMPKQTKQCFTSLREVCIFFGLGTYLERCAAFCSPPEARKQRRAPEKLKMMSQQAKHYYYDLSIYFFVF